MVAGVPECHFEQLHAAFHLAHKYQCNDVEARILFVLKKYYTSDFTEHDGYAASKYTLLPPPPRAAIAAVNIARLTDMPSMLPFALYLVCTLEGGAIDGYERRDGSVEHLSAQDLKLCMNARGALAWGLSALAKSVFFSTEYSECMQPNSCLFILSDISDDALDRVRGECDVLKPYRDFINGWTKNHPLCKACKQKLLTREREERGMAWMKLPGMFGFTVEACGFTSGDT